LFKKAAVFTDIHFGLKGNSRVHNEDCEEFIDWFIATAKENGCETGIFCGDWHHNRNSLNLTTMDSTIRSLEKLGKAFDQFINTPIQKKNLSVQIAKTSSVWWDDVNTPSIKEIRQDILARSIKKITIEALIKYAKSVCSSQQETALFLGIDTIHLNRLENSLRK